MCVSVCVCVCVCVVGGCVYKVALLRLDPVLDPDNVWLYITSVIHNHNYKLSTLAVCQYYLWSQCWKSLTTHTMYIVCFLFLFSLPLSSPLSPSLFPSSPSHPFLPLPLSSHLPLPLSLSLLPSPPPPPPPPPPSTVSCTAPHKYSVTESHGTIDARCCVDL